MKSLIMFAAALLLAQLGTCIAQTMPSAAPTRTSEAPLEALVRVDRNALALALPRKNGPPTRLLLHGFEFDGDAVSTEKLHLRQLAPGIFEVTSIAYEVGEWRVRIRDAADFYGLGGRSDTLNHAHTVVHNLSHASSGAKGSGTTTPVPFFMSTTGYGIWFDVTGDATFDLNATSKSEIVVACDAEKLRIVLFTGPEFPNILAAFTSLAGRAKLPPYWAFAPWLGSAAGSKARELGLPGSVVLDDTASVTPAKSKLAHQQGYKLVVAAAPAIGEKATNYAEAAAFGFLLKPDGTGPGSFVDFTNARARLWWQQQAIQAIDAGADGLQMDQVPGDFAEAVKFSDGSDPRIMRNRYGLLFNKAAEEVIDGRLKGDGVLLARTATAGNSAPGFLRSSGNAASFSPEDGLPTAVVEELSAGMSGMPLWAADTSGATGAGAPNVRLFLRWTEFAAFSPVMLMADQSGLLPWECGDAALTAYRRYATLHMALFPYRYAAAEEAANTGMPIVRALALKYQDDANARAARYEYLFGPDMLVAPIVDEGVQRTLYLPAGKWLDYWTGALLKGSRTIVVEAAPESIPVFVSEGAVIPMLPDDTMTLVSTSESGNQALKTMDDRRVYELFGDAAPAAAITTDFEGRVLTRSGNKLTITGDSAAHIILRWRFQRVETATVDGETMKIQSDDEGQFIEFDHLKQTGIAWH